MSRTGTKAYIGDGVYVDRDDRGLVLTTEDGVRVTNTIYLEAEVWAALIEYVQALRQAKETQ